MFLRELATQHCFVRCRCAVLNGAFLGTLVYSLFYIGLEPFAGVTWSLSTGIPCWLTATAFMQHVPHAWAYAIAVHALSWYVQIHVGHVMLEHRKPALLDSFFQVRNEYSAVLLCAHTHYAAAVTALDIMSLCGASNSRTVDNIRLILHGFLLSVLTAYCYMQSLALANLFVWLEFLFFCGYRKDLQAKLAARIEAERAKMLPADSQTTPLLAEQSK